MHHAGVAPAPEHVRWVEEAQSCSDSRVRMAYSTGCGRALGVPSMDLDDAVTVVPRAVHSAAAPAGVDLYGGTAGVH